MVLVLKEANIMPFQRRSIEEAKKDHLEIGMSPWEENLIPPKEDLRVPKKPPCNPCLGRKTRQYPSQ